MMVEDRPITGRCLSGETLLGGGATTLLSRPEMARFISRSTCGGGAIIAFLDSAGAMREALRPSAGGGPGTDLKASRFATGWVVTGNFMFGASTTLSLAELPRATRMVWVLWWECWPPARPLWPTAAPPKSWTWGSSSP